jgi:hypothetical protein
MLHPSLICLGINCNNHHYFWSNYSPTIHNHLWPSHQVFDHSLLHSNTSGHNRAHSPLSIALYCNELCSTALQYITLSSKLNNLNLSSPLPTFHRHVAHREDVHGQPRSSSVDHFPEYPDSMRGHKMQLHSVHNNM